MIKGKEGNVYGNTEDQTIWEYKKKRWKDTGIVYDEKKYGPFTIGGMMMCYNEHQIKT